MFSKITEISSSSSPPSPKLHFICVAVRFICHTSALPLGLTKQTGWFFYFKFESGLLSVIYSSTDFWQMRGVLYLSPQYHQNSFVSLKIPFCYNF